MWPHSSSSLGKGQIHIKSTLLSNTSNANCALCQRGQLTWWILALVLEWPEPPEVAHISRRCRIYTGNCLELPPSSCRGVKRIITIAIVKTYHDHDDNVSCPLFRLISLHCEIYLDIYSWWRWRRKIGDINVWMHCLVSIVHWIKIGFTSILMCMMFNLSCFF